MYEVISNKQIFACQEFIVRLGNRDSAPFKCLDVKQYVNSVEKTPCTLVIEIFFTTSLVQPFQINERDDLL